MAEPTPPNGEDEARSLLIVEDNDRFAETLGCRRGTVKSRLHRAMGRLRTELEKMP